MTLGNKIKLKREQAGMSQQDLAEKLFVSRQTVSRWESGARTPDLVMAKKIAMTLGITLDDLFTGADLEQSAPARQDPWLDLSAIKVMLSGMMLLLFATCITAAEGFMDTPAALCMFLGVGVFIVGLLIPWYQRDNVAKDDRLPQKTCPKCSKSHDFDFPKCPHCGYDYLGRQ